jgi:C-terminal processing protease CtpA/Prc
LSCIENSPAARAGIHQGDELVEINGTDQVSYSKIFNLNYGIKSDFL